VKKKAAERDKHKPGSLAAILGRPKTTTPEAAHGAPQDHRVGDGSVWAADHDPGRQPLRRQGALAIREQFTIPPFLSETR